MQILAASLPLGNCSVLPGVGGWGGTTGLNSKGHAQMEAWDSALKKLTQEDSYFKPSLLDIPGLKVNTPHPYII